MRVAKFVNQLNWLTPIEVLNKDEEERLYNGSAKGFSEVDINLSERFIHDVKLTDNHLQIILKESK